MAIFVAVMNISGHVFWIDIIQSKELPLFFTVTTLISQSVLLILIKNYLLLKIGFYYWLFVLIMNVTMTMYLYFGNIGIIRPLLEIFLFIRARTFWLFSTSELLYLPGFEAQGLISKENLFSLSVFLLFHIDLKSKKLPR
ncbi:hypothetical protein K190097F3_17640 [Enterocloster clostridioformis]|uniref:hypothetical protein n=1 Tax=Lachnospiraceae TaxID=186803 RepID=UPI000E54ED14|nr:hypothetical protein [Hungatella hathewayi]RHB64703.1 hypothetical protein DW876_25925 [Hungatella hathewayi]